ncbi:MAG: peptidylprolyl isomerase [Actinomycetes bacterium]
MLKRKSSVTVVVVMTASLAFSLLALSPANAATKPVHPLKAKAAVVGTCLSTTSVGHRPKMVAPPSTAALKTFKARVFTLKTNCGDIVITADQPLAPLTTAAMYTLSTNGFFDHSLCHRLTTSQIFVLQCGDPTATGRGGPAFSYSTEYVPAAVTNNYPAGSVAMANSGPDSNGSQFFLFYEDTTLNPNYTLWGRITKGLDIIRAIAAIGVADGTGDGKPKQTVAIESVSAR